MPSSAQSRRDESSVQAVGARRSLTWRPASAWNRSPLRCWKPAASAVRHFGHKEAATVSACSAARRKASLRHRGARSRDLAHRHHVVVFARYGIPAGLPPRPLQTSERRAASAEASATGSWIDAGHLDAPTTRQIGKHQGWAAADVQHLGRRAQAAAQRSSRQAPRRSPSMATARNR